MKILRAGPGGNIKTGRMIVRQVEGETRAFGVIYGPKSEIDPDASYTFESCIKGSWYRWTDQRAMIEGGEARFELRNGIPTNQPTGQPMPGTNHPKEKPPMSGLQIAAEIERRASDPNAPSFEDLIEENWKIIVASLRGAAWQPIATAPKDGTKILAPYPVWLRGNTTPTPSEFDVVIIHWNGRGWDTGGWMLHEEPHVWMPRPEAPDITTYPVLWRKRHRGPIMTPERLSTTCGLGFAAPRVRCLKGAAFHENQQGRCRHLCCAGPKCRFAGTRALAKGGFRAS